MGCRKKTGDVQLQCDTRCRILASLFPLVAFALQWFFWAAIQPYAWFLFYPAIFFSSWLGGQHYGLVATALSTIMVWWFFIPERYSFVLERPASALSIAIFAGMGVLFSLTHERLRKANQQTAAALAAVKAAKDHLEEQISERTNDLRSTIDALWHSEADLRKAQEIAKIGSWTYDMSGRILWSDMLYRIYGVSPETFTPNVKSFLNLIHPDDRQAMKTWIDDCSANKKPGELEFRTIWPDGTLHFISGRGELTHDADGKPTHMSGTAQDITERKQAEIALQKLNDELEKHVVQRTEELEESRSELEMQNEELRITYNELEVETAARLRAMEELRENEQILIQQNRMAAMGEMLGNIAHQWRQPLNVVGLTIQRLGLSHELGEFNKELLDDSIKKTMDIILHLSQTIDDFMNLSLPDIVKSQFSVDQLIAKTVSLIEDSFKEQQISIDIETIDAPRINGYANEYAQVLLNILMNARDALLEQETKQALVRVRSWTDDGRAVVTITDNGGGIREDIMAKIFDPFFTTKELGKGIGVGLFMSKTIIEKNMGGRLTVRNVSGGAEFRIEV